MTSSTFDVVGVDLSFTRTGIAWWRPGESVQFQEIKTNPRTGSIAYRSNLVASCVAKVLDVVEPRLVALESPSFGSVNRAFDMGGLRTFVMWVCEQRDVPVLQVAPRQRAGIITGHGGSDKEEVMQHLKRRLDDVPSHDVGDAIGVATAGLAFLGLRTPLDPLSAEQLAFVARLKKKNRDLLGVAA